MNETETRTAPEVMHYFAPGAGIAYCGSDVRHNGEHYSTYEGDATCPECLRELAESGRWPGAADVLRILYPARKHQGR